MGGTDSEVYITIVGENGDTGKRILNKPLNESDQPFSQGSVSLLISFVRNLNRRSLLALICKESDSE